MFLPVTTITMTFSVTIVISATNEKGIVIMTSRRNVSRFKMTSFMDVIYEPLAMTLKRYIKILLLKEQYFSKTIALEHQTARLV